MHIVITQDDLARLSSQTRAELQRVLFGQPELVSDDGDFDSGFPPPPDQESVYETMSEWAEVPEVTADSKVVIDITPDQVRALIGNLGQKSVESLKEFGTDGMVRLDSLVGEGRSYETFSELKRSFVGAVNRRLRTVTRNRSAVLFRRVEIESEIYIAVRPSTADALRQVLSPNSEAFVVAESLHSMPR